MQLCTAHVYDRKTIDITSMERRTAAHVARELGYANLTTN